MCHYGEGRKAERQNRRVQRAGHLHTQEEKPNKPAARFQMYNWISCIIQRLKNTQHVRRQTIINSLHQEGHACACLCVRERTYSETAED